MDRSHLESMLRSIGDSIEWPAPSPRLPTEVLARIESHHRAERPRARRRLAAAVVVIVLVTGAVVLSPAARQAAANLLRAAGIRVGIVSDDAPPVGADLNLGTPIGLDEVATAVGFAVRVPAGDDPGPPDGVYLGDDGAITMVWGGLPTLPAAGDTGVAVLLAQRAAYDLRDMGEKLLTPETVIRRVEVDGQRALWIEGAPHTFVLLDGAGTPIEETARLAANVLLWEAGGVNHRLETTGDLGSALDIAARLEGS